MDPSIIFSYQLTPSLKYYTCIPILGRYFKPAVFQANGISDEDMIESWAGECVEGYGYAAGKEDPEFRIWAAQVLERTHEVWRRKRLFRGGFFWI
jgi:hypothetical protein